MFPSMKLALWLNINMMMMVMRRPLIDLYFIYIYYFSRVSLVLKDYINNIVIIFLIPLNWSKNRSKKKYLIYKKKWIKKLQKLDKNILSKLVLYKNYCQNNKNLIFNNNRNKYTSQKGLKNRINWISHQD